MKSKSEETQQDRGLHTNYGGLILKFISNYPSNENKNMMMKNRALLCAGLVAIGATISLDFTGAMAEDSAQSERSSQKNAEYYKRSGNAKIDRRDYQGAVADINEALKINPNDSDLYNLRGIARNKLFDHSGAIDDFNRALEINSNNSYALKNINELREGLRKDREQEREREQRALDQMNRVRNSGGGTR